MPLGEKLTDLPLAKLSCIKGINCSIEKFRSANLFTPKDSEYFDYIKFRRISKERHIIDIQDRHSFPEIATPACALVRNDKL
jgi:hypothetical protein